MVGYQVFIFVKIGSPMYRNNDPNSDITEQKIMLVARVIPTYLKPSWEDFLHEINKTVPMEEEFNEWYSRQRIRK